VEAVTDDLKHALRVALVDDCEVANGGGEVSQAWRDVWREYIHGEESTTEVVQENGEGIAMVVDGDNETTIVTSTGTTKSALLTSLLLATETHQDYPQFAPSLRVELLAWLCTEFLLTTASKAHIEDINDMQAQFDRESRMERREQKGRGRGGVERDEDDEEDNARSAVKGSKKESKSGKKEPKSSKKVAKDSSSLSLNLSSIKRQAQSGVKGRPPKAGKEMKEWASDDEEEEEAAISTPKTPVAAPLWGMNGATTTEATPEDVEERDFATLASDLTSFNTTVDFTTLTIRHFALGSDRFGNQYWAFHSDPLRPSLYVEMNNGDGTSSVEKEAGKREWRVYSDVADIAVLGKCFVFLLLVVCCVLIFYLFSYLSFFPVCVRYPRGITSQGAAQLGGGERAGAARRGREDR
jgi:hypothetical protein